MISENKKNFPLAIETWDEAEREAIQKVIESNRFTMGPFVFEFEKKFAEYFGAKYAIMVNSGSSANLLAIGALRYKTENPLIEGDEIIVPAVSWSTTYYPVNQFNFKLKFVDIDYSSLNINVNKIVDAITPRTRAIFAVNLLGNPCDMEALQKICQEHNLYLIEDNCESMGAKHDGKYTGTFGELGTFSTFFSHHISTMEGGMILTDNEELYNICRSLRAHGWTRDLPQKSTIYKKKDPFYEMFNFILPGYNLRPLEMSAAIGLEQLKKLSSIVEGRRNNAAKFLELVKEFDCIDIQHEYGSSSWFGFALLLKGKLKGKRDQFAELLQKNNIECRPIVAGNFVKNPVIEHLDYSISGNLNVADYIHENGLFIGNNQKELDHELEYLRKIIKIIIEELIK